VSACSKCAGEMEAGSSSTQGAGHHHWFGGNTPPEWSMHLFPPSAGWSAPLHRIVTYRCKDCGFLESYAPAAE
jgi:hypothetical protein